MPDKKKIQLPGGVDVIKPNVNFNREKAGLDKEAETVTDSLLGSEWQPYNSRPRSDVHGPYVILKWFAKQNQWVPLYVGTGSVGCQLSKLFSGKDTTPIGKYLSSFPRNSRKLIWVKWLRDASPPHSEEKLDVEDIVKVISAKYNGGERPPFNFTAADLDEPVSDNYSILGV